MQVIAPPMTEHRLIMRMVALIREQGRRVEETNQVDVLFVDTALDFIRIYADRTHHGKEEAILFRDAAKKKLAADHRQLLDELLEDHDFGRKTVRAIDEEKGKYVAGDRSSVRVIAEKMKALSEFYPEHIRKEDNVFFPAAAKYLSTQEQDKMLREFWDFDMKMIHMKYNLVVENAEKLR